MLDALLQCQPDMFRPDFYGMMLMMNRAAPPAWLWNWITDVEPMVISHPTAVNATAVTVQICIGLGLMWRPTVRPALALSVPWALVVWLFGEMGGGIFVGGGSALTGAPGPALLYAVSALLLWPRRPDVAAAAADGGLIPRSATPFVWVALWAGTAALESGYLDRSPTYASQAMDTAALTGPGWLHAAGEAVGGLVGGHGALFAACAGTVQAAIGLGVLFQRTRRGSLVAGALLALFYAVVGQALGGILSNGITGIMGSGATDPGTGPIVVLLALALWPRRAVDVGSSGPAGAGPTDHAHGAPREMEESMAGPA